MAKVTPVQALFSSAACNMIPSKQCDMNISAPTSGDNSAQSL